MLTVISCVGQAAWHVYLSTSTTCNMSVCRFAANSALVYHTVYCYTAASIQYTLCAPTTQSANGRCMHAHSIVRSLNCTTTNSIRPNNNPSIAPRLLIRYFHRHYRTYVLPCHTVAFCSVSARYNRRTFHQHIYGCLFPNMFSSWLRCVVSRAHG
jgi:hypothetical protein